MNWKIGLTALAVCGTVACTRDLSYPPTPQQGSVSGWVNVGGHLPGAGNAVVLVAPDNTRQDQVTDADGGFAFGNLQPGSYYVDVSLPGFAELTRPNVVVKPGANTDVGELAPSWLANTPLAATVLGKVVVEGATSNPDLTGGYVDFLLEPVQQPAGRALLAADGTFVQQVPPGTYDLRATHPLYVTATVQGVQLAPAEYADLTQKPIALSLNPATLTGSVSKEVDGAAPVAAANVLVTLEDGSTTTSDSSGNFSIGGLAAGSETVRFGLQGFHDPAPSHPVTLSPGQTTTLDPVILMLDRGAVSGTVAVSDQTGLAGAVVALAGTPYSAVPTPSASQPWQGTFQISNVPVGVYQVQATKPNYVPVTASAITVVANATVALAQPLTLTPLRGNFVITGDPATPGYTRTSQVTLDLSALTSAAQYRASEDSTFNGVSFLPFTTSKPTFTLVNQDGTHTVYVQYQDSSGTTSPTLSSSIVLDSTPPGQTSVAINGGAPFTNISNPLLLNLRALDPVPAGADAVSGLWQVWVNDTGAVDANGNLVATPQAFQQAISFTRSSSVDGPETISVQFEDRAGNFSPILTATVYIETVAPTGSLSVASGALATAPGYTNNPLVTLAESASAQPDGGYVLIRLANNQAALSTAVLQPVAASSSWFIDANGDGNKTVYAQLQDAAGNLSPQLSATIVYDTTPPSPAAVSLLSAAVTSNMVISLGLNAADLNGLSPSQAVTVSESPLFAGAGTVDPMAYPASAQLNFTVSSGDGPKTVYVRYRDVAGNNAVASAQLTLKTSPPTGSLALTGTLADGTPSSTLTTNAAITAQISNGNGATGYVLSNGTLASCPTGGYLSPIPSSRSWSIGGAGANAVSLCLIDAAGNTAGPFVQSITLDTDAPTGCVLALTGTKRDGTAAPAGETANATVTATLAGCSEPPAQVVLAGSPLACSATGAFAWIPYASTLSTTLSHPDQTNTVYGCVQDAARNTAAITSGSILLKTSPPSAPQIVIDNGAQYVNAAQVTSRGGDIASVQGIANGAFDWAISETVAGLTSFRPYSGTGNNPVNFTFGGTGTRTLYGIFRDDVGNASAVAQASITFKTTPPSVTGTTLAVLSPSGTGFVNSVSVQLQLTGVPSDATQVLIANAASSGACATSDFNGIAGQTPFAAETFLLPAGDGLKRICAEFVDAAGNVSSVISATTTLDTVPPTVPVVVTADQVLPAVDNSTFTVTLVGAVTEANFSRFEILGGKITSWQPPSPAVANVNSPAPSFTFNLVNLGASGPETGTPNRLRIHAVDLAGNISPEASVVVTADTTPPSVVGLQAQWVHNRNGAVTVFWPKSTSPDVTQYLVYYGSASGAGNHVYDGINADQGVSPFSIPVPGSMPANLSTTLSGLPNNSNTFITVRPVDHAGNVGGWPVGVPELVSSPSTVPGDLVAAVSLWSGQIHQLARSGDVLYAAGYQTSNNVPMLAAVDISTIVSPVQGGQPQTSPPGPTLAKLFTFAEVLGDPMAQFAGEQLVVDDHYLFLASGPYLRIFDLSVPLNPTLVDTIDFTSYGVAYAQGLVVRGNIAYITERAAAGVPYQTYVIPLSLNKLYDNDYTTVPTLSDALPKANAGLLRPTALAWTRNDLLVDDYYYGDTYSYDLTPPLLDGGAPTLLAHSSALVSDYYMPSPESGNYYYAVDNGGTFSILDLTNIWAGGTISHAGNSVATFPMRSIGQVFPAGEEIFVSDTQSSGVHKLDATNPTNIIDNGVFVSGSSNVPLPVIARGNYLLAGTGAGQLLVYELAAGSGFKPISQTTHSGPKGELVGGFVYTGTSAVDLENGTSPVSGDPIIDGSSTQCVHAEARVDDINVLAVGTQVIVANLENAIDRNAGTTMTSQYYSIAMPAGVRATGVRSSGNYLVFVEVRSSASTSSPGTWLEVVDARKLRGRNPTYQLSFAGSNSFQVTTATGTTSPTYLAEPQLALHRGRAFVTLNNAASASANGLYIVDLRAFLDDDQRTTTPVAQGYVQSVGDGDAYEVAVQGNYAYVADVAGLEIIDVHQALDEDPTTVVPSNPSRALVSAGYMDSVFVAGSYAFAAGTQGNALIAVDVSKPLTPVLIQNSQLSTSPTTCGQDSDFMERSEIMIAGSRAYLTLPADFRVLQLE